MSPPLPFKVRNTENRPLHGLLDLPEEPGARPTVVLCHGFKGFMEWGFFPHLASLLAARGFTVVRFNFSGSGMLPAEDRVGDLDAFRHATFSRDLDDLRTILGSLGHEIGPNRVDRTRIGLLGHSRGGGCALLAAARAGIDSGIRCIVTWAAVATFDRTDETIKTAWRRSGELTITNARTGQELPIDVGVLEDLEEHRERLDLLQAAGKRRPPWLIVHGDNDETVPVAEARSLAAAARQPWELSEIPGAGHTFGAQHPFVGPTPHLIEAMNASQVWLRRHL